MANRNQVSMGGLAALAGGAVWVVGALLLMFMPLSMAEEPSLTNTLITVTTSVGIVGFLGALVALQAGGALGESSSGRTGTLLAALGLLVLMLAGILGLFPNVEFDDFLWPLGGLAVLVGLVMVGMAAMRTGALPQWRWLPIAIGITTFLNIASWAVAPFVPEGVANWLILVTYGLNGIAWAMLGYGLWTWASRPVAATQ